MGPESFQVLSTLVGCHQELQAVLPPLRPEKLGNEGGILNYRSIKVKR